VSTQSVTAATRRDRIVEAALELFAAKGFDGASTKEIAATAEVAEGLIFHHFENKESLLAAVFETQRSYFGELEELSSVTPDIPAGQVLSRLAGEALARLRRESRIAVVLFGTAQTDPEMRARLQAVIGEGTGHLARYLESRRTRGELRQDMDTQMAAFAFLSPLFLFFLVHRDLPDSEWKTRSARFVNSLLTSWLDGNRVSE
jgi:AcrR family transcriptional regulator